jgi:hypothetical protein
VSTTWHSMTGSGCSSAMRRTPTSHKASLAALAMTTMRSPGIGRGPTTAQSGHMTSI